MGAGNPIRISWSALRTWSECRTKYRIKYVERKTAHVTDHRNFLAGTVADRAMRAWLESPTQERGGMESLVEELFHAHTEGEEAEGKIGWRGNPNEDRAKIYDKVVRCVRRLEPILEEHVLPYEYHPELRFETWLNIPHPDGEGKMPIGLRGGIDLAVRKAPEDEEAPRGHYALHDLKTTEDASYVNKTLGQSTFYDIAFGSWIGDRRQPEEFTFMLPLLEDRDPVIPITITDDDRRDMLGRIIEMAHGIARAQWGSEVPEGGAPCWNCEAKPACPLHKPVSGVDEFGTRRASFLGTAARRARAGE